ncbi:hypothetical protein FHX64_002122 [Microbacter margulisiae]|uniref:Uncharacterized protein n=1 Tax=Microbacter margulisiae TaxID=1350067 RepID=A0A7W5H2U6_9PORP|nr:hypothetical protein [Microbacter margulisiae]
MKNHYSFPPFSHRDEAQNSAHILLPKKSTIQFIMSYSAAYWTVASQDKCFSVTEQIMN